MDNSKHSPTLSNEVGGLYTRDFTHPLTHSPTPPTQLARALFAGHPVTVTAYPSPAAQQPLVVRPAVTSIEVAARAAVGRLLLQAPQRFNLVEHYGVVAAVRIIPRAIEDPIIPVALCEMTADHWWAMRRYWDALTLAITGRGKRRAERRARLVLETLDGLTVQEREFFAAHLWGAFNGEA